jgi:hypothetical protein
MNRRSCFSVLISSTKTALTCDPCRYRSANGDLARLCRKARVPFLKMVEGFPDGQVLFDFACKFRFERYR